jgi:hypothetical protein
MYVLWRYGLVVIVSVNGTEDCGFECREGVPKGSRTLYTAMLFFVTRFTLLLCVFE